MNESPTLDGKPLTAEKLQEEIKKAEQAKGKKIVEVAPNTYRTKLED